MVAITIKSGGAVAPGTYPATLISVVPKQLVTRYSKDPNKPDDFLEWTWAVEGIEVNSLTTLQTGPKSRIFEYLTALLGADRVVVDASLNTDDLIGMNVLAVIINDDEGWARIERIVAAPRSQGGSGAQPAKPKAKAAAVDADDTTNGQDDGSDAQLDDLPF